MRRAQFSADAIASLLRDQTIAAMPELMAALGSRARRTVFRKLRELAYRCSYSHRGRYYTLDELTDFDDSGLWSYQGVRFSAFGTLLDTAAALVPGAQMGYFVEELDHQLHVGTKDVLRQLVGDARLARQKVGGQYLYCAADAARQATQLRARRRHLLEPGPMRALADVAMLPDEQRAAIVLFLSLLDEQQRRLYAGLESLKSGRGGDRQIAELLGLDAGTVARGRRALLEHDVQLERIRRRGAGRKPAEKKRRKSSPASKR